MRMEASQTSYLIVGAGVFGASTALYLKRSEPSASVTLIDRTPFPNPSAASHDVNKIIRSDYPDIFYAKRALKAQKLWRSDPIYREWYHETGIMFAENIGMGRKSIENYNTLGLDHVAELTSPEIGKARFGGFFRDANWTDNTESYWNPRSGWAEAAPVLKKVMETAIAEGVTYVEATIASLCIVKAPNPSCTGLETVDGRTFSADNVILSTGAFTAKLLADSMPNDPEFQVNGRMVAAGAVSCTVKLSPKQQERYKNLPVFFNGMPHTHGESIPTTSDGYLKFNHEVSFTNKIYHKRSGQIISVPPEALNQSTWTNNVPQGLKEECAKVIRNIYGKEAEDFTIDSYRMCWDAVTPNQEWIISPHPKCSNLFIATAGSFHAWKFLPTLGSFVAKMLHGELSDEEANRWAWDREYEGDACEMYIPKRDLKDIKGYAASLAVQTGDLNGNVNGHVNDEVNGKMNGHTEGSMCEKVNGHAEEPQNGVHGDV